ncbi:ProQ/FINO family protein [Aureimonas ureilytica]|uniref:ProQ/FINO family protein n=1 Tax=Aureimonas ureilytica TaxID=401562 RepID=UPI0009EB8CE1|nr:ProQ/FINO family protein [Aureimonas ureilytica]
MTENAAKAPTLWKKARGPIVASPRMVELAEAINAHLLAPIGVLPNSTERPVLPFAIGISAEIEARIKPGDSMDDLKIAIRKYVRHRTYLLAMGQPNSTRHDIDGNPVEPVSEENRQTAITTYTRIQAANEKRRKAQEQAAA